MCACTIPVSPQLSPHHPNWRIAPFRMTNWASLGARQYPLAYKKILEHIFVISKLWGLRDDITECGEAITQVTLVNWHCNGPATQLLN